MFPLEDGHGLHGTGVPDVDSRVPANLPCGNVVVGGVDAQAKNVVCVGRVKPLFVGALVVDYSQRGDVVDYL